LDRHIEAVIFDYGHTLARYEIGTWEDRLRQGLERVHAALAAKESVPPLEEYLEVALSEINVPRRDHSVYPLATRFERINARLGLDSAISVGEMELILMSPVLEIGEVDQDAHHVLQTLRERGYKLGLISNCPYGSCSAMWREEMHGFGLDEYLDSVIFCDEVGVRKPDPAIFELSLQQLGVKAANAMYVGDYQPWDIEGGHGAGLATVWINIRHEDLDPALAAPDYTITRLSELLDLPPLVA
jgi:HAD superfamily hydrolase (TIGR01509 family)